MSIGQRFGQPSSVEKGDEFEKADAAALAKVASKQSEIEWFLPFAGAVINNDECEIVPLKDYKGVFAIIDNTLQGCVGYTTNPNINLTATTFRP